MVDRQVFGTTVVALLEKLTALFPPPPRCNHSITLTGDPTEPLRIHLWVGSTVCAAKLSVGDLDKDADTIYTEIVTEFTKWAEAIHFDWKAAIAESLDGRVLDVSE